MKTHRGDIGQLLERDTHPEKLLSTKIYYNKNEKIFKGERDQMPKTETKSFGQFFCSGFPTTTTTHSQVSWTKLG